MSPVRCTLARAILHRTYLTAEGTKAPVEPVKKLMTYPSERMLTGGAIRLFPAGATLGVAEGIETALAVHQATGLPTWSAVSAGLLAQFRPPAGVREVLIWADLNRSGAGQGAAAALAERLKIAGLTGRILLPPDPVPAGLKGIDWLDVLTGQGALAVRSVLRAAA